MTLKLHNTLSGKLDEFKPISDDKVTLYTCGPTVYDYPHVGNWSSFLYWDILVRTLLANGYTVERVMNITDVGHLVSDADDGEDKLEKGARREGKTAWEIAEFYAEDFVKGMDALGLIPPEHLVKATDFIPQQLALVRTLKEKGYTYQTTDGIYFDTAKFPNYAAFAHLDLAAQKAGARVEANDEKRQPWDFALWKFTPAGQKRDMEWETPDDLLELGMSGSAGILSDESLSPSPDTSPETRDTEEVKGGRDGGTVPLRAAKGGNDASGELYEPVMGFPGWHLECSAMAMNILGDTIDIHTGGIDHIPVHHTNEIAQSEAASGKQFAHYWLHNNHLKIDGGKISKSLGNGYTLQDLKERGFSALDLRMFVLQSQFTSEGNFTWDNLAAAKNRLTNWKNYTALRHQVHSSLEPDEAKNDSSDSISLTATSGAVKEALNDNLNTPKALTIIDEAFSQLDTANLQHIHRYGLVQLLETIDELLGLQLLQTTPDITEDQKRTLIERQRARDAKDWKKSDELRDELSKQGIAVRDTSGGTIWSYAA